jgi:hypothetical protein
VKIIAFFLCVAVSAIAETNTLTFTNKAGGVIKDAPIISFNAKDVFYRIGSGGGTVHLADLPADLQKRFNYNRTNAAAFEKKAAAHKQAMIAQLADAGNIQEINRLSKSMLDDVKKTKMYITGRIIQRLDRRLLVDSASEFSRIGGPPLYGRISSWTVGGVPVYDGTCILTGYFSSAIDGDVVSTVAYPNGTYTYTAVSGAEKTVRRFTVNPDDVSTLTTDADMLQLTRGRDHIER